MVVRAELARKGLFNSIATLCAIFNKDIETIDHLFLRCYNSWRLWTFQIGSWDLNMVLPNNMRYFLLAQNGVITNEERNSIWCMAFFTIMWIIWYSRNDLIFKGEPFDIFQYFETTKFRIGWWIRAKRLLENSSVLDVVRETALAKAPLTQKKKN